jgi:hypothetical protein
MAYNPKVKVYYIKDQESANENNRLVPAPKISITPEYYYANNIVVGYTYAITINGFATSIDLRTYDGSFEPGFVNVLETIQNTKNIFNNNNGTLLVTDNGGIELLKAPGSTVRSLNFDESDNRWINYSPFTVELEANEVILNDCEGSGPTINCTTIPSGITINPNFIDLVKYRIKSYSDSWGFNLNENIYNSYEFSEESSSTGAPQADFKNEYFDITYSIDAVGKNYFVNGKVLPAWEQAKNFCQKRLYKQVSDLINNVLPIGTDDNGCVGIADLNQVHTTGPIHLLQNLDPNQYKIFNEKIRCETSEAEGKFSLVYSAILKRVQNSNDIFLDTDTIHTFNITKSVQDDGKVKNISIDVEGNIQGLVEGGLIKTKGIFELPETGQILLTVSNPSTDRYTNALATFDKIRDGRKLKDNFAKLLGISLKRLGIKNQVCTNDNDVPKNSSFNSTHNYNEGIITYNTSYTSDKNCNDDDKSYTNVSISIEDSAAQTAEFIIPGRADGPIIQYLGYYSPKRYTINIDGATKSDKCCPTIESLLSDNCDPQSAPPFMATIPNFTLPKSVITSDRQTYATDGSYSLTRSYIVYDIP